MKFIKRLIAGFLYLIALSFLLIGSCAGPGVIYYQSPLWFLEEVDPDDVGSFFVAFNATESGGSQQLFVMTYKVDPEKKGYANVQYHMTDERRTYSWGSGEGNASIYAKTEAEGRQLVQIFVTGDTPWTSLSEYRVVDNKIHPLRHAHSKAWLLLVGVIVCLLITYRLSKPLRRGIRRFMRIEPG